MSQELKCPKMMAEVQVEMKTITVILKFPMNVEAPYKW